VLSRISQPIDVIKLPILDDWHIASSRPSTRGDESRARILRWMGAQRVITTDGERRGDGARLRHGRRHAAPARRSTTITPSHGAPRSSPTSTTSNRPPSYAGAFGCSISGSGPTVFAITAKDDAGRIAAVMQEAFANVATDVTSPRSLNTEYAAHERMAAVRRRGTPSRPERRRYTLTVGACYPWSATPSPSTAAVSTHGAARATRRRQRCVALREAVLSVDPATSSRIPRGDAVV